LGEKVAHVKFSGVVDTGLEEAVELFLRREDAERIVRDWDDHHRLWFLEGG
jgi:hypothetical protein